jgi:hypothetical protein
MPRVTAFAGLEIDDEHRRFTQVDECERQFPCDPTNGLARFHAADHQAVGLSLVEGGPNLEGQSQRVFLSGWKPRVGFWRPRWCWGRLPDG